MTSWNQSSSSDDEVVFAGFHRRGASPPRGSSFPQTPKRTQSPSTAKETLVSPEPPSMFQMGQFASDDLDDVVSFRASSTTRPDPEDISFSLSKPEATRRTIEKLEGSNAYIITRRGDRPHTPFSDKTGGKPLDSDVTKVQRATRGFNLSGSNPRSLSQSLTQRHPSQEPDVVRFVHRPQVADTASKPAPPVVVHKVRGTRGSITSASSVSTTGLSAPTRRISTQGKVEVVPSTRGRNRSLVSDADYVGPLYNGDDVETTHI